MKYLISILFLFSSISTKAQSLESVEKTKNEYQNCLDKGENMLACAANYYSQSEEQLSIITDKILSTLSATSKLEFQRGTVLWTREKVLYFDSVEKEIQVKNPEIIGSDLKMIVLDRKADFNFKRIMSLLTYY
jgi:hypothetical protein